MKLRSSALTLAGLLCLASACVVSSSNAQPLVQSSTPDFIVSAGASKTSFQQYPNVVYNPKNNEYLSVFVRVLSGLPNYEGNDIVWGQRLDGSGNRIGPEFQIGPSKAFDWEPAVAYNSVNNEYLVVWRGNEPIDSTGASRQGVYGQVITADGQKRKGEFKINAALARGGGPLPTSPSVTYNGTRNEYFVVWADTHNLQSSNNPPTFHDEFEIWGQRVNGNTLATTSTTDDIRVSNFGPEGDGSGADFPKIVYNGVNNEYLAIWRGRLATPALQSRPWAIYGGRINATTGAHIENHFKLSPDLTGPPGLADVAFNPSQNEYLVVFQQDYRDSGNNIIAFETYGQRIKYDGTHVGAEDFRISKMSEIPNGPGWGAIHRVVYRPAQNQYVVIWMGTKLPIQYYIWGQLLDAATGAEVGAQSFQISETKAWWETNYASYYPSWLPSAAVNEKTSEICVLWLGGTLVTLDNYGKIFTPYLIAPTPTPTPSPTATPKTNTDNGGVTLIQPARNGVYPAKSVPVQISMKLTSTVAIVQFYVGNKLIKSIANPFKKARSGKKTLKTKLSLKTKGRVKLVVKMNGKKVGAQTFFTN